MFRVALLGAGLIAKVHARHIHENADSVLYSVSGSKSGNDRLLADQYGACVMSAEEAINHPDVDVVLIATPNDTHADYALMAARAGKAVFCEKPIDLDEERVRACIQEAENNHVPFMIGFNRRFDPNHSALRDAVSGGEIGEMEHLQINSRDPSPPSPAHLAISGGLFHDMTIHDFDMARFILGDDEPVSVSAVASALVNDDVKSANDVDTAVITLRTGTGKIVVINNSRRSGYGYDQRLEAHGKMGAVQVQNVPPNTLIRMSEEGKVQSQKPYYFVLDRYHEAFRLQWASFINALLESKPVPVSAVDGLKSLLLANAAKESLLKRRVIDIDLNAL